MPSRLTHHMRHNVMPVGRRVASKVVLACALVLLAVPALAQAGTLSYNAGTRVLTYTGSNGANIVFADHPGGDTTRLRVVDVGGEEMTAAGAPACEPDDINFYLVCPAPAKLVVLLGGGDDSFSDETVGGGEPTSIPIEVNGGDGTDELDGGGGTDVLRGGLGSDTIQGDNGADAIDGEDGDDTLDGGAGNDGLAGGPGNDRLTGGPGNDTVRGAVGNDELDYSPEYALDGTDVYEGGAGHDMVGYFGRTVAVRINLDGQPNDGQAGENDNIAADIEEVDGGDVDDVLVGSAGANGLAGRGGDDRISGLGGNDLIYGDTGNDIMDGGAGNDKLDGGCQDDNITGGPGVDSFNADGTCASPVLRGMHDVIRARDGVRDSLVICTMSGPPGDTAIVDSIDPTPRGDDPGACRTVDVGTAGPGSGTTPPGSTGPGATATLTGKVRARLGSTLRLLSGTGRRGQAVRQLVNLRTRTLTLGSLVATSPARLKTRATIRIRGRTVSLGSAALSVQPKTPRTLRIRLSRKGKAALRRLKMARITVRFVVHDPSTKKIRHRSSKTFRIKVKR